MELNTGSSFTVFWSNLNLESLPFFQGGGGEEWGGSGGENETIFKAVAVFLPSGRKPKK